MGGFLIPSFNFLQKPYNNIKGGGIKKKKAKSLSKQISKLLLFLFCGLIFSSFLFLNHATGTGNILASPPTLTEYKVSSDYSTASGLINGNVARYTRVSGQPGSTFLYRTGNLCSGISLNGNCSSEITHLQPPLSASTVNVTIKFFSNNTLQWERQLWADITEDGVVTPPGYNSNRITVEGEVYYTEGSDRVPMGNGITINVTNNENTTIVPAITGSNGYYDVELDCGKIYYFTVDQIATSTIVDIITAIIPATSILLNETAISGSETLDLTEPANCTHHQLDIELTATTIDLFAKVMSWALELMLKALNYGIQSTMGMVEMAIEAGAEVAHLDSIENVMLGIRNTALSLLTLGLLIIAFANILNFNIEQYGVTKMIPKFVLAIIMAYFSLFITQLVLEFTTALTVLLRTATNVSAVEYKTTGEVIDAIVSNAVAGVLINQFQMIFLIIILLLLLIISVLLVLILYVRKVVLMFLVAVAPLAFIMMIMPFTEKYYKEWWGKLWQWAIMGPAIMFLLYLGNEFLINGFFFEKFSPGGGMTTGQFIASKALGVDSWAFLLLVAATWIMALFVPLKLGKEVYGKIQEGWKKSGSLPYVGAPKRFLDQRGANVKSRLGLKTQQSIAKVAQKGKLGRLAAGLTEQEAEAKNIQLLESLAKEGPKSKEGIKSQLAGAAPGSLKEQALIYGAVHDGLLDASDQRQRNAVLKYASPEMVDLETGEKIIDPTTGQGIPNPDFIPGLEKAVPKENAEFDAAAALGDPEKGVAPDSRFYKRADASLQRTQPADYKPKTWIYASTKVDFVKNISSASFVDKALKGKPESQQEFSNQVVSGGHLGNLSTPEQIRDVGNMGGASIEQINGALKSLEARIGSTPTTGASGSGPTAGGTPMGTSGAGPTRPSTPPTSSTSGRSGGGGPVAP
jgi:hypothetical protein